MWWMTLNHNPSGASDGSENIQSWNLEQHAIYMATVAQVYKSKYGIEFETVDTKLSSEVSTRLDAQIETKTNLSV